MMTCETKHRPKLVSLENAAEMIESGDSIWVGSFLSIPNLFLDELADRCEELHNVTVLGCHYTNYSKLFVDPKYKKVFNVISFFESAMFRSTKFAAGNIGYIKKPGRPYQKTLVDKFNINTMVVEVCPPDNNGNCNVSVTGRTITPYLSKCEGITKKIAVINSLQRPSLAEGELISLPLSDFDYICICNH